MKAAATIFAIAMQFILSIPAQAAQDCQAYCAYMEPRFSKRDGLFSSTSTSYYRLNSEVRWITATSWNGLAQQCPKGYLVLNFDRVFIPEQSTPAISVEEGYYLKNIKSAFPESACLTVRGQGNGASSDTAGSQVRSGQAVR